MELLRKILPNFSYTRYRALMAIRSSSSETSGVEASNNTSLGCSTTTQSIPTRAEGEEFRYLLRNSNFVNLGDPENKIVRGKIYHVVSDDLYIDFGWKFHCVCARPSKGGELYVRGAEVLLKVKDLELSSKFLGASKGLTLLEADASIVKLVTTPVKQKSES